MKNQANRHSANRKLAISWYESKDAVPSSKHIDNHNDSKASVAAKHANWAPEVLSENSKMASYPASLNDEWIDTKPF